MTIAQLAYDKTIDPIVYRFFVCNKWRVEIGNSQENSIGNEGHFFGHCVFPAGSSGDEIDIWILSQDKSYVIGTHDPWKILRNEISKDFKLVFSQHP